MPLAIASEVYKLDVISWRRDVGSLISGCGRFHVLRRHDGAWLLYDRGRPVTVCGHVDGTPHEFARQRDAKQHAAYVTTGERLHIAGLIQDPLRW